MFWVSIELFVLNKKLVKFFQRIPLIYMYQTVWQTIQYMLGNSKMSWWRNRVNRKIIKVSKLHSLGTTNACDKCHGIPTNSFWDLSLWTKLVDSQQKVYLMGFFQRFKPHIMAIFSLSMASWMFMHMIVIRIQLPFKL